MFDKNAIGILNRERPLVFHLITCNSYTLIQVSFDKYHSINDDDELMNDSIFIQFKTQVF